MTDWLMREVAKRFVQPRTAELQFSGIRYPDSFRVGEPHDGTYWGKVKGWVVTSINQDRRGWDVDGGDSVEYVTTVVQLTEVLDYRDFEDSAGGSAVSGAEDSNK